METRENSAMIIMHPATEAYYESLKSSIFVKAYSTSELAKLYNVCTRTFKKWIRPFKLEIGERNGRFYTVHQVKVIFEKLDVPHLMHVA